MFVHTDKMRPIVAKAILCSLVVPVTQLSVLSITPGEDPPVCCQSHGVPPSSIHSHLPHHVHPQVHQDLGDGCVHPYPNPQAAVGPLTTGIDLAILRDDEEGLGTSGKEDRVELCQALVVGRNLDLRAFDICK